jgi:AmpE protein
VEFLAILVALGILQLRGSTPLQEDSWYAVYRRWIAGRLRGIPRQAVLILVPVVAVVLLQRAASGRFFGLAELALFVLVLLYALGRGNVAAALTDYLQRWSRGDFQAAFRQLSTEATGGLPEPDVVVHPQALHELARRRLYYRHFERLFAVLFWFVVLGPAGALAYRIAVLEQEASRGRTGVPAEPEPAAVVEPVGGAVDDVAAAGGVEPALDAVPAAVEESKLLRWIEWVPARLAGISFALVGDFDACLYAWQRVLAETRLATAEALERCGNAALTFAAPEAEETTDNLIARGSRELQAIENLNSRALLVWLVLIALLAMIF